MKKVLFLSALLVVLACVPAFSAYMINWTDTFEANTVGGLAGQADPSGWGNWQQVDVGTAYADTDLVVTTAQNHTVGGNRSAMQRPTAFSSSMFDMTRGYWGYGTNGNSAKVGFTTGYARFWVYEPGTVGGSAQFQAGVFGDGEGTGTTPFVGSITNNLIALTMRESTSRDFWMAQWSGDIRKMDGTVSASTASYKWSTYRSAPRRATAGWSWIMVSWGFDMAGGTGWAEYRVNNVSAAMRVDFDSNAAAGGNRWKSTAPIVGIYAGQTTSSVADGRNGYIDDVEFHGNFTPEPTSLLALGTGLIGLVGLIRRKK